MIQIHINPFINGFSIVGYDSDTGKKFLDEIQEERVVILEALQKWVTREIVAELERRQ